MALFTGKILEARYMDTEYSVVEVLYDGGDGNVYSHALRPDPESQDWIDLVADGWDQDKLIESTVVYKKAASNAFSEQVNAAAKLLLAEKFGYDDENQENIQTNFSWDNFFNVTNYDTDKIFEFKIWGFESEKMKNASEETKINFRKAKTFVEAIKIYETLF